MNTTFYKKLGLIAVCGSIFITNVNAQYKRYVIYESFTNTSCGPCASGNPKLEKVVAANPGKVHNISFHVNWPGSNDPMYTPNPTELKARWTFYKVSGVPDVRLDGNKWSGQSGAVAQSQVDKYYSATGAPIGLHVTQTGTTDRTVTIEAHTGTAAPSGTLKIRVAVVEKKISYSSAPGSNGEKVFYYVFRDYINKGDAAGEAFTPAASGSSTKLTYSYSIKSTWKEAEIAVIAIVQNDATKEVINSGASFDTWSGGPTGIDANEVSQLGKAYPNPVSEFTTIPVNVKGDNAQFELTDVYGRLIKRINLEKGEQNLTVNLFDLSAGTYVYRVIDNNIPSKGILLQVQH